MSLRASLVASVLGLAAVGAAPVASAREIATPSLADLVPNFTERLTRMHMQEEGVLDGIIPPGPSAQDPWEPGIVIGQFAASAAVNILGVYVFNSFANNELATIDSTLTGDALKSAQRGPLLKWGFFQFALVPLVSGSAIWGVGNLSEPYEVAYGIPLLANYVAELALILARIGIGLGGLQGADAAGAAAKITDALGIYNVVDYILHGLVVPVTVTYFSIRSRAVKGYYSQNERPLPASEVYAALPAPVRSAALEREERSSDVVPLAVAQLVSFRF